MRIICWNINGIKAHYEGLKKLIEMYEPDIICLQKVKSSKGIATFPVDGYKSFEEDQHRSQWYGTAVYYRKELVPLNDVPVELAESGHFQAFSINQNTLLFNIYAPFSNTLDNKFIEKRKRWNPLLAKFSHTKSDSPIIMCGDFNVVREIIDCWDGNSEIDMPCFFDWERQNFNSLIHDNDLVDVYRCLHPAGKDFSYFDSRDKDRSQGYRIDYFLISRILLPFVERCDILTDFTITNSNPLLLDIDITSETVFTPKSEKLDKPASKVISYTYPPTDNPLLDVAISVYNQLSAIDLVRLNDWSLMKFTTLSARTQNCFSGLSDFKNILPFMYPKDGIFPKVKNAGRKTYADIRPFIAEAKKLFEECWVALNTNEPQSFVSVSSSDTTHSVDSKFLESARILHKKFQRLTLIECLDIAEKETKGENLPFLFVLQTTLSRTTDRNFEIFKRFYGLDGIKNTPTLEDLAKVYNLTRERVRQIIAKVNHSLNNIKHLARLQLIELPCAIPSDSPLLDSIKKENNLDCSTVIVLRLLNCIADRFELVRIGVDGKDYLLDREQLSIISPQALIKRLDRNHRNYDCSYKTCDAIVRYLLKCKKGIDPLFAQTISEMVVNHLPENIFSLDEELPSDLPEENTTGNISVSQYIPSDKKFKERCDLLKAFVSEHHRLPLYKEDKVLSKWWNFHKNSTTYYSQYKNKWFKELLQFLIDNDIDY